MAALTCPPGKEKEVLAGRQASERETNPWSVHPVGCAHVISRVQW
nr:hypothetical protein [Kibdelosporangium sp. MJ126-NF4]